MSIIEAKITTGHITSEYNEIQKKYIDVWKNVPNSAGGVSAKIEYYNNSGKEIKYLIFKCIPMNPVGDIVASSISGEVEANCRLTGPIKPKTLSTTTFENVWYNNTITRGKIVGICIQYMDGTEENLSENDIMSTDSADSEAKKIKNRNKKIILIGVLVVILIILIPTIIKSCSRNAQRNKAKQAATQVEMNTQMAEEPLTEPVTQFVAEAEPQTNAVVAEVAEQEIIDADNTDSGVDPDHVMAPEESGLEDISMYAYGTYVSPSGDTLTIANENDAKVIDFYLDALNTKYSFYSNENVYPNETFKASGEAEIRGDGFVDERAELVFDGDSKLTVLLPDEGNTKIEFTKISNNVIENEYPASTGEYLIEGSDNHFIDESELLGFDAWTCKLARNEIYARHGRKFSNADLQQYFDSQPWYTGTIEPDQFDESVLNKFEKENITTIKDYEKANGFS